MAKEMQNIDKLATEEYGIPGIVLMDQAAKAVADTVLRKENFSDGSTGKIVILCGKGNNGGDGFGAARYLQNAGMQVEVFLINATLEDIKGDAAIEANMLYKAGVSIKPVIKEESLSAVKHACLRADIIVDAMLGTGFKGELKGLYKSVCHMVNALDKVIVAVDIPTGVDADLGTRAEDAIWADTTVTMALPKTGLLLYPGKENVGELILAGIGMPDALLDASSSNKYLLQANNIKALLPVRKPNAHKGDAGRVVIAAGSPGFIGAAAMCSWGAVKAGAGLVSLLTAASCREILSIKLNEVMVHGLKEKASGVLDASAIEKILQQAAKADVLAVGPGFGTSEGTAKAVLDILAKCEVPVVIDADALTALKGNTEILQQMTVPKVLTPHPGEMARLTGLSIGEIDRERVAVAGKYAMIWNAVVVLKGAPTVIGLPGGQVFVNTTGCNAMATGGSGDVLTGIIAAYIASGMDVASAALAGVYLHGLAGEIASGNEIGLAAGEIANTLPLARKQLYENENLTISIYNTSLSVLK